MSLRPLAHVISGSLALLILGGLAVNSPSKVAALGSAPREAPLNHATFDAGKSARAEILAYADLLLEHIQKAHSGVTLTVLREAERPAIHKIHFLIEAASTQALSEFNQAYGKDEVCRGLLEREQALLTLEEDAFLRLIASDPEKEQRMEPYRSVVVWELDADFPRVGQAIECAEGLVRHLNATYPELAFRAYDAWYPRSGAIASYRTFTQGLEEARRKLEQRAG